MRNTILTFETEWKSLENFVSYHARRFGSFSHLNTTEDFFTIGQQVVWSCLSRYKPVCSKCGEKYASMEEYRKHLHSGKIAIPTFSFESFTKSRVLSAFQSEIKKEVAQKRNPVSGFKQYVLEPVFIHHEFKVVDIEEVFDLLLRDFDSVQRAIIKMLSEYTVSDIVLLLEPHGYTLGFVRETIRRFRQDLKSFYSQKNKTAVLCKC